MIESDLSEGFGLKPGCVCKSRERRSLSLFSVEKDLKENLYLSKSRFNQTSNNLEDDFIILQQALKSKYDAINILKRIGNKMRMEKINLEDQLLDITVIFKNEIMKLQNELDDAKKLYYDNQKIWLARFNELDNECLKLKEDLKKKSLFIQNLMSDNIDLLEENQKLMKFFSKTKRCYTETIEIVDDSSETHSAIELLSRNISDDYSFILKPNAVKHSKCHCVCNINIFSKHDTDQFDQMKVEKANTEDAYIMVEAYRLAFEEILKRNRELTLKISKHDE